MSTPALRPTQPRTQQLPLFLPGGDGDCTVPSIAVTVREWSYTSTSSIRLHDMYRDNFTSYWRESRNSHVLLGFNPASNNIRLFNK